MKPTEQQLQEIYEEAVSAECAEKQGEDMPSFDLLCRLDEVGGLAHFIRTMIEMARAGQRQQEPVADVVAWHKEGEERTCDIRWRRHDVAPGPLYAVPQIPDEATPDNIEILASIRPPHGVAYQWDEDQRNAAADAWNACRGAMTENQK